ncbi:MAG: hypothetical protein CL910_20290 [Deltaproteobacteria bacterium]|nr:hypothetical protein [Deltaproteobacteria bacterium]
MTARTGASLRVVTNPQPPIVPSALLGMLLFLFTELMLFSGLVSAHGIARGSALLWPPPGQPRLPVEETALNTAALLASGVLLYFSQRAYRRDRKSAQPWLTATIALGTFFVVFQGVEWVALVGEGLTITSSTHGGFFYLIIGVHGLHAVGALLVLGMNWLRLRRGVLSQSTFAAGQAFWYFVVGVWPVLYWRVYG